MRESTHLHVRELTNIPSTSVVTSTQKPFHGPSSPHVSVAGNSILYESGDKLTRTEATGEKYIPNICRKKVTFSLLFLIILGAIVVGIVLSLLPNSPTNSITTNFQQNTAALSTKITLRVQINITGIALTPTYGTYLRCSISNKTDSSSNDILITSWTENNGTVYEVTPLDPLNSGNCGNSYRRQRLLSDVQKTKFRQLFIIPISPISMVLSMKVISSKIAGILSYMGDELHLNFSTLDPLAPNASATNNSTLKNFTQTPTPTSSITSSSTTTPILASLTSTPSVSPSPLPMIEWDTTESLGIWRSVASSVDGKYIIRVTQNEPIMVGDDYGETWVMRETGRKWMSTTSLRIKHHQSLR